MATESGDNNGSAKRKSALIGIGGAVASAAVAAALLYVGRKSKDADKLRAAEMTPPTD